MSSSSSQKLTARDGPDRRSAEDLLGAPARRGAGVDIPGDYAATLADLARSWRSESGHEQVLAAVVRSATVAIPGAHRASIATPGPERRLETAASSDDVAGRFGRLQDTLRQGPGPDAVRAHGPVRTGDLGTDPRWPALARGAAPLGIRSVLSVHLYVIGGSLGVLTLASGRERAFDAQAEQLGVLLAAHAAVALRTVDQEQGLRTAFEGRDVIGQAKGILMQRHRISADHAFAMLVSASQDTNIKLREVAEHVVAHLERTAERADRGRAAPARTEEPAPR